MWVQRGFVVRVQSKGVVVEYALNELGSKGLTPEAEATRIGDRLKAILDAAPDARRHDPIPDEAATASHCGSVDVDPFGHDPADTLVRLAALRDGLLAAPGIASAWARADFVQVSRCFVSPHRDLSQTFAWSQAYVFGLSRRGNVAKSTYRAASGLFGLEILDRLEPKLPELAAELGALLDAVRIEPGEYDVILDSDMAGTLAHEAFGHGVELDMFVKERAKAVEYFGKRVASPLVTMYDGALGKDYGGVDQTGSFLFDDEGNLGTKTTVIKDGILVAGFSDCLSALDLHMPRTGNGRRQAYDHKAYARMTNTYFEPKDSSREAMIASTKKGWFLERLDSGMEDPRNWGIQLIALVGKEIVDGKFSGRVASPVFCSGYVPDVLGAISMVSKDFELGGSGACGKGYKEFVKVSSGGPCVKTRMRLG
jgi:TldD protein